jgi:hypothetical protein
MKPGPKPKLRPEQAPLLLGRYRAGVSPGEMAPELGVHRSTLVKFLHEHGLSPEEVQHGGRDDVSPEIERAIVDEWNPIGNGTTLVGRKFGYCKKTIRNVLARNGIELTSDKGFRLPVRHGVFDVLTPEAAYWVGMLMADGCVSVKRSPKESWNLSPQLILCLHRDDEHHIRRFQEFIGATRHAISQGENDLSWELRGWGNSLWSRLAVASQAMCNRLTILGVTEAKTFTAKASPEVAMDRDFWRGVIDGDGTVACNQSYLNILGSINLCNQFMFYLDTTFPGVRYHLAERPGCWQVGVVRRYLPGRAAAFL